MTDTPTSTSPLATADPNAIERVFLADPRTYSDAEWNLAILELRRRRSEFHSAEAAKSLAPKVTRTKKDSVKALAAAALDKPIGETKIGDLLG